MKPDDFEQKLQRQPLRQIPAEWRGEILSAAREVRSGGSAERRLKLVLNGGFLPKAATPAWLENLLWPHPRAWAGLAAVWICIFAVNFSIRDKAPVLAEKSAPPSPEVAAQIKLQQRMLAEMIGANQARDAEPARLFLPTPRSERTEILMT